MNEHHLVDDAVRAYLRQQQEQCDPTAGLRRVRATLEQPAAPTRRRFLRRGLVSAAAVVLAAVLFGSWYTGSAQGREEKLVRQALQTHSQPVDRCYAVETKLDPGTLEPRFPLWAAIRHMKLWTRGDRFYVDLTIGQRAWSMGSDKDGGMWLAVNPQRGVRYEAGEVPDHLARLRDVYSMRVETLLHEVLADFDLKSQPAEAGVERIQAELKSGHTHPTLHSATLDIDAETKVLRRVVLHRGVAGRPVSAATFTLVDTQTLPDSRYELEGHLTAPYQVFTRTFEPDKRRLLLQR